MIRITDKQDINYLLYFLRNLAYSEDKNIQSYHSECSFGVGIKLPSGATFEIIATDGDAAETPDEANGKVEKTTDGCVFWIDLYHPRNNK